MPTTPSRRPTLTLANGSTLAITTPGVSQADVDQVMASVHQAHQHLDTTYPGGIQGYLVDQRVLDDALEQREGRQALAESLAAALHAIATMDPTRPSPST